MSLKRAAGAVSSATLLSRVFGLIREQIFAALLGAGFYSDAFIVAYRIPNLLRDLFAEGALSSAFVPTFAETEVKESAEEAYKLANLLIGVILAVVGTIALLGILFAPAVVWVFAPGFYDVPGKSELTILLTRIMFPFLPTVALAALFMGMLNVKGKYGIPAFAPVLFNAVAIVVGLGLWAFNTPPRAAVVGWSIATLGGGIAQAGIQFPYLMKLGFRWKPTLAQWKNHLGLRQVALLMLPAVIGLSATQVNALVNTILASQLEQGAPSWLNYAFRLMHLPLGVFGVGIGMVALPMIARDFASQSFESMKNNLTTAVNLVLILTIPAAVGLWVLGEPIVRLIYEHGRFGPSDTVATASALAVYAIGLPAYSAIKVVAPAFYAMKDSRAPMYASMCAVAANLTFNLLTYKTLGFQALAFGTSLAAFANVTLLVVWLQLKQPVMSYALILDRVWKILVASGLMAIVSEFVYRAVHVSSPSLTVHLIETFVPIAFAAGIYFLVLAWLNVPEAAMLLDMGKKLFQRTFSR